MTLLSTLGPAILLLHFALACHSFGHLLLRKEDLRSALSWFIAIFALPFLGTLTYWVFGISRISRRARKLMARRDIALAEDGEQAISQIAPQWQSHAVAMGKLSERKLTAHNSIEHFHTGTQAYPAMLKAIENANKCIYVCFYNFDGDGECLKFIKAIGAAKQRGLDVKVVLDGLGTFASRSDAIGAFKRVGVTCQVFNPPKLLPPRLHINLRNHRKLLLLDNQQAFTGGMNIVNGNVASDQHGASRDECFLVKGPVINQLHASFLADWSFSGGELGDTIIAPASTEKNNISCRAIEDGPDQQEHAVLMALVSACTLARERIWLVSPYFIPPPPLVTAIQLAALRGVEVRIIVPEQPDHRLMSWACEHALSQLLRPGITAYAVVPPFMHSKLYLFDSYYCQFGSANLDARSLKLNFEMLIEAYDENFAQSMAKHIENLLQDAKPLTLDQLKQQPIWRRLRAALTTVFAPYL